MTKLTAPLALFAIVFALFAIVFTIVFALVFSAEARASYGDPKLDAIATTIAGHPVQVSCGSNSADWASTEQTAGYTFDVDGFTYVGRTPAVIYLAPRICDTIEADLHQGVTAVGDYWNGLAIKAFIHESTHQKLESTDEALVECTAYRSVRQYAPLFGYAKVVSQTTYVKLKSGTYKRVVKTVPNPALARLVRWATFWHQLLPAPYQNDC